MKQRQTLYFKAGKRNLGLLILLLGGGVFLFAQNLPTKVIEDVNLQGTGTTTWYSDTVYLLSGRVYVNPGDTLTIQPGTVIKGKYSVNPAETAVFTVSAGAYIHAEGTAQAPIIFTSELDDVTVPTDLLANAHAAGLWGGIFINGFGCINDMADSAIHEGLSVDPTLEADARRARFGAIGGNCDDTYDAGIFRYVSIRYSGQCLSPNLETNAITLAGIGNRTVFDHIEVVYALDDGFEFLGGTVCGKYLMAGGIQDDAFDFDLGNRSTLQYITGLVGGPHGGNRGIEIDGSWDRSATEPIGKPEIYNATLVALNPDTDNPGSNWTQAATIRDNAGAIIKNSVFVGFDRGIRIENQADSSLNDSYSQLLDGNIEFACNLLWETAGNDSSQLMVSYRDIDPKIDSALQVFFFANQNEVGNPLFKSFERGDIALDSIDLTPLPGSPLLSPSCQIGTSNTCVEGTVFRGAFPPETVIAFKNFGWASDWTFLSEFYYSSTNVATNREVGPQLTSFEVSPNPVSGEGLLRISWETSIPSVRLSLIDLQGRDLQTYELSGNGGQIKLPSLSQGVYILQAEANGLGWQPQKIVIR